MPTGPDVLVYYAFLSKVDACLLCFPLKAWSSCFKKILADGAVPVLGMFYIFKCVRKERINCS